MAGHRSIGHQTMDSFRCSTTWIWFLSPGHCCASNPRPQVPLFPLPMVQVPPVPPDPTATHGADLPCPPDGAPERDDRGDLLVLRGTRGSTATDARQPTGAALWHGETAKRRAKPERGGGGDGGVQSSQQDSLFLGFVRSLAPKAERASLNEKNHGSQVITSGLDRRLVSCQLGHLFQRFNKQAIVAVPDPRQRASCMSAVRPHSFTSQGGRCADRAIAGCLSGASRPSTPQLSP